MSKALELYRYANTDKQRHYLDLLAEHGSYRKAANAAGISERNFAKVMARLNKRAAERGYTPDVSVDHPAPDGYLVKGKSTLYDKETGESKLEWVKTERDRESMLRALMEVLDDYELPKAKRIKAPQGVKKEYCTVYTLTDFHLGMYAFSGETGDNWDTEIATQTAIEAFDELINASPESEYAVFNQLGDFMHWDGIDAVTPTSGHILDADTRFHRLVGVAIDLCVLIIERLLEKHKYVRVLMCEGNHDIASSAWLQHLLARLYGNNPRVTVDVSATPFYVHKHGNIMLAFHHGHKVKNKSLPALFSSDPRFRATWGECEYTYIHTGHYHMVEQDRSEHGGAIVERHPTLAGRDAYAARGGFVSKRSICAITYHKDIGEYHRVTRVPKL